MPPSQLYWKPTLLTDRIRQEWDGLKKKAWELAVSNGIYLFCYGDPPCGSARLPAEMVKYAAECGCAYIKYYCKEIETRDDSFGFLEICLARRMRAWAASKMLNLIGKPEHQAILAEYNANEDFFDAMLRINKGFTTVLHHSKLIGHWRKEICSAFTLPWWLEGPEIE